MNCKKAQERLVSMLLAELDDRTRQSVLEHLDQCDACRQQLEALRATIGLLQEAFDQEPVAQLDSEHRAAIEASIATRPEAAASPVRQREELTPFPAFAPRSPTRLILAAAAVVAVLISLSTLILPTWRNRTSQGTLAIARNDVHHADKMMALPAEAEEESERPPPSLAEQELETSRLDRNFAYAEAPATQPTEPAADAQPADAGMVDYRREGHREKLENAVAAATPPALSKPKIRESRYFAGRAASDMPTGVKEANETLSPAAQSLMDADLADLTALRKQDEAAAAAATTLGIAGSQTLAEAKASTANASAGHGGIPHPMNAGASGPDSREAEAAGNREAATITALITRNDTGGTILTILRGQTTAYRQTISDSPMAQAHIEDKLLDFNGDGQGEVVVYLREGETAGDRVLVFGEEAGKWSRWLDVHRPNAESEFVKVGDRDGLRVLDSATGELTTVTLGAEE